MLHLSCHTLQISGLCQIPKTKDFDIWCELFQASCGLAWKKFTSSHLGAVTVFTSPSKILTTNPMWPSMISFRLLFMMMIDNGGDEFDDELVLIHVYLSDKFRGLISTNTISWHGSGPFQFSRIYKHLLIMLGKICKNKN